MMTVETKNGSLRYFDNITSMMYNAFDICKMLKVKNSKAVIETNVRPWNRLVTTEKKVKQTYINRTGISELLEFLSNKVSPECKISFLEWIDSLSKNVEVPDMNISDETKAELRRFSDYIEHHIHDITKSDRHSFKDTFKNGKLLELYLRLRENKIL